MPIDGAEEAAITFTADWPLIDVREFSVGLASIQLPKKEPLAYPLYRTTIKAGITILKRSNT
jgi:hypothetical protein